MSKTKAKIIKFYMTDEEKQSRKKAHDNDEEESAEEVIKKPEALLKKIIPNDGLISQIFTYNEADILIVIDRDKKPWYKGKDIAIILEYANTRDALIKHVTQNYKKSYADIGVAITDPLIKIDPQTIFISSSGLFQLISRSKKPEAMKFYEFITEEVIPELLTKGTYTLPAKESDIAKLNKSFYDNNMLSNFADKPVMYLSYIGQYNI